MKFIMENWWQLLAICRMIMTFIIENWWQVLAIGWLIMIFYLVNEALGEKQ